MKVPNAFIWLLGVDYMLRCIDSGLQPGWAFGVGVLACFGAAIISVITDLMNWLAPTARGYVRIEQLEKER